MSVVLNPFYISYPFTKQSYQIYPQYSQCYLYIKYEFNEFLKFKMIYKNLHWLHFMVKKMYSLER